MSAEKMTRGEFENDNVKLIAQYSTRTPSDDADDEREQQGPTKRRSTMNALDWKHCLESNTDEVKRRISHGITKSMRGDVWQLISGGRDLLLRNPGVYSHLLSNESESEKHIVKDIHRTLTSHQLFQTTDGPGRRSLHNVLKAYSVYDTEVGYTQGMNFIAGMLLLHMNEEEAFWVMVALFKGMQIRGLYLEDLPLLHQYFFQFEILVKEQLPELARNFERQMITPAMYASSWFMTAFSADLPFPLVVRIWDVFLFEGMKAVLGLGLALLKLFHNDMLKLPFYDLLTFLRGLPEEALDADILIPMACSLTSERRLKELELYYLVSDDQSSASKENDYGGWALINPTDYLDVDD